MKKSILSIVLSIIMLCNQLPVTVLAAESDISVTIAELTEFVFGKRDIQGLEEVMVLSRMCINEAV